MKKIVLLGSQHAKWISSELVRIDINNKYTYIENLKSLRSLFLLIFSDVVFFTYGPVSKKQIYILKLLIFLKKTVIIDWIGTDVYTLLNEPNNIALYNKANNICEVEWIQNELNSIGINAKVGPYITRLYHGLEKINVPKENKDKFIVMSYSGAGREKFYGIDMILEIANEFPDIIFKIVGTKGESYKNVPKNIIFLGWIPSTKEILEECSLFVRVPIHDGLSLSVLEALYYEKKVAFTFDLCGTILVKSNEDLKSCIKKTYSDWKNNIDIRNYEGKNFVLTKYFKNQEIFLSNLQKELIND